MGATGIADPLTATTPPSSSVRAIPGHIAPFPVTLSTLSTVTVTVTAIAVDGTAAHNRVYLAIAFPVRTARYGPTSRS